MPQSAGFVSVVQLLQLLYKKKQTPKNEVILQFKIKNKNNTNN